MNTNPYESPQGKEAEVAMTGVMDRFLGWLRGPARRDAWCSFCGKNYRDTGPLVEGPNHVYICYPCSTLSAHIIEMECSRRGTPLPKDE